MILCYLFDEGDESVGSVRTIAIPEVGHIIEANNGTWIVTGIHHDVPSDITPGGLTPKSDSIVAYVRKIQKRGK